MDTVYPILALDLATATGWALIPGAGVAVQSGVKSFYGGNDGAVFTSAHGWLSDMVTRHRPRLIYHERPFSYGRGKSGGDPALPRLMGFYGILAMIAHAHEVPLRPISAMQIKKFAAGKGNATKEQVVEAVEKMGYAPADHNEADALALLEFAILLEDKPEAERRDHERWCSSMARLHGNP